MLPKDRVKPISSAATKAPTIEPMPPMTVTMNDFDQDREPHAGRQRAHRRGERAGKSRPASRRCRTPPHSNGYADAERRRPSGR